jgi:hypothetical protein
MSNNIGWWRSFNGSSESVIPTYGNWTGPGWSGGKRTEPGEEIDWSVPPDKNWYGQTSQVDAACKDHDWAYRNAQGQENENELKFQADMNLLYNIMAMDMLQMDPHELQVATTVFCVFVAKINMVDHSLAMLHDIRKWADKMGIDLSGVGEMYNKIRSLFNIGATVTSPIILDLDKDGVETTAVNNGTYFDHDANGFSEQTGWASSDDGLLVMDRDADGLIEDGTELFGNNTILANGTNASNGFQALAELDSNADGKIDANDAAYSQLRIWQDIDEDGYNSFRLWQSADKLCCIGLLLVV